MTNSYARAYTEVLEILKYLPTEEYEKIPKEKIAFYNKNKDNNYSYMFNETKQIDEQKISREANAIIVSLFRDFFATPIQKEKLEKILKQNERKHEEKLKEKYNPDNIFKNYTINTTPIQSEPVVTETAMIEYKKTVFDKIKNWFKKVFRSKI